MLSNRKYDVLKKIATVVLPAVSALYFTVAQLWGLPKVEEILGTIAAVGTFLGVFLGVSSRSYDKSDAKYDGDIDVTDLEDETKYLLRFNGDPAAISTLKQVVFKVNGSK